MSSRAGSEKIIDTIEYEASIQNVINNEHLTFDATYTYIKAHKAHVDTSLTGNEGSHVTAEYSNSIQLFGFSLNYKF